MMATGLEQMKDDNAGTDETREQLDVLCQQHRVIDAEILELTGQASYDQIRVQRLKKQKLKLRDQIAILESSLLPDIIA